MIEPSVRIEKEAGVPGGGRGFMISTKQQHRRWEKWEKMEQVKMA
jgi:hypothetical protein